MNAVRIDGQTPGGKRTPLADVVPLDTPYVVQIFPIYACNLSCPYCIHSVPVDQRGFITGKTVLDYNVYKKCIDDIAQFPHKLKMLRFAGTGEPLLHKDIADMIDYATKKEVAESIDIVTNGLALSHGLSLALVSAGVNKIRISVQGLNDEAYAFTKQKGIFQKLIKNIRFLYDNRRMTKIYIKIIDCALSEEDEEEFIDIFGDICDYIAIEHLIPAVDKIDYEKVAGHSLENITQNGVAVQLAEVCPQPFYMLQLNPDGMIVPCCSMETAYIAGDISKESIKDIWCGEKMKRFRKSQLLKKKGIYTVCKNCQQYRYAMFEEDVLDNDIDDILKKCGGNDGCKKN